MIGVGQMAFPLEKSRHPNPLPTASQVNDDESETGWLSFGTMNLIDATGQNIVLFSFLSTTAPCTCTTLLQGLVCRYHLPINSCISEYMEMPISQEANIGKQMNSMGGAGVSDARRQVHACLETFRI